MLLHDIVKVLADAGHGTKGVDLEVGSLPEEPINAVAVRQYPGADPVLAMGGSGQNTKLVRPRFQVRVRNSNQETAWTKAGAIQALLRDFDGVVNGTAYHAIWQVGDLGEIAEDGNLSYSVVGSYEAWKDPS